MIAISSHRPLKGAGEYVLNQLRALASWQEIFDEIIYFGPRQNAMMGPKVRFIEWEPFPQIAAMCAFASQQPGWSCLINADIVVTDGLLAAQSKLNGYGADCAVSKRYEFEGSDYWNAKIVDNGLDFFCALPYVWDSAVLEFPDWLRMGKPEWDSCMLSHFTGRYSRGCFDLTSMRFIYHPKHGGRNHTMISGDRSSHLFSGTGWPAKLR